MTVTEITIDPSAFKMYMDPESSKEIPVDRQILPLCMLVITLMPDKVSTPNKTPKEKKLRLRMSLKRPFAMMSTYILSVFGARVTSDFWSALTRPFLRDTVSSVGAFRNKYHPGAELAENICFFRHALALDELRVKFIPEYIFAKKEWFSPGEFGPPRCKEVWFRGSHSDM